jgi:DNA-binding transcriptional LysR family regulator
MVIFAEVATDGSFSRAAARLNVAQPWLSAQVQKLEAMCGIKLFERLNTGLELTPEGRELLPYARQVADASRGFRETARTMGDVRNKSVRVGAYLPMLANIVLHRLNGAFALRYPQYSLVAEPGAMGHLLDALRNGQVDLLAALSPLPEHEEGEFDLIPLDPVAPYLLVPLDARLDASLKDLTGQVIAAPAPESHPTLLAPLLTPLRSAGATIRLAPEPGRRAMEHLARNHGTVVLMIEGGAEDYVDDPAFTTIPLSGVDARHVLVRMARRGLARAAERYWSMAKALPEPI